MAEKKAPAGNGVARRRANQVPGCPLTAAWAAIGGKWKMIIIYWLAEDAAHFAALRRKMPGISQKVLTQQLRELCADGLIRRRAADRLSEPVIYSLTPYGRSLVPLIEGVRRWGRSHLARTSRSQLA